jgi:hypothetical protein
MDTIIEYTKKEMRSFREKSFCSVDSLVLSQFSYINFEGLVPGPYDDEPSVRIRDLYRAECFESLFSKLHNVDNNRELLIALAASPRFRDIRMNYFIDNVDSQMQMQFSAITFFPDDHSAFIAFRGTDGTIIGWKEDFNMAFTYPLPSQEAGLLYLNSISGFIPADMTVRVGGHSKGGNIAVYAAMTCHPYFQKRITEIYNHDGPGFKKEVLESPEFAVIHSRIQKTLPQSSVFGLLLHQQENYSVVESSGHGGFMQHDPFNWCIVDSDFCYAEKLAAGSVKTHHTINQWLSTLSNDQRKLFIDTLYELVKSTRAKTLSDLTDDWLKGAGKFLSAAKDLDPETKKFVQNTFSELVKMSIKNIRVPRKAKTGHAPAITKKSKSVS